MEYQFIKDPIDGFRLLISDEQANIARWLVDETGISSSAVNDLLVEINQKTSAFTHDVNFRGKEMVMSIVDGEVAVRLNQHGVSDFEQERFDQEMLSVDTTNDLSECGLDDFLSLLEDWYLFLKDNRV